MSQNIFHHNSNKRWSKFMKTGKHIRLTKLMKAKGNDTTFAPIIDVGPEYNLSVESNQNVESK